MQLYIKDTHDLMCNMEDGKPHFKMGWVQNTNETQFYCLCSWMSDLRRDTYDRPWLSPPTYPETHIFDTEHEAMQALIDAKDGYTRYIYQDCVHWVAGRRERRIDYCVVRFPFVPDYHLCDLLEDDHTPTISERPLQQFKTLTQALAVLKVITGSQR